MHFQLFLRNGSRFSSFSSWNDTCQRSHKKLSRGLRRIRLRRQRSTEHQGMHKLSIYLCQPGVHFIYLQIPWFSSQTGLLPEQTQGSNAFRRWSITAASWVQQQDLTVRNDWWMTDGWMESMDREKGGWLNGYLQGRLDGRASYSCCLKLATVALSGYKATQNNCTYVSY